MWNFSLLRVPLQRYFGEEGTSGEWLFSKREKSLPRKRSRRFLKNAKISKILHFLPKIAKAMPFGLWPANEVFKKPQKWSFLTIFWHFSVKNAILTEKFGCKFATKCMVFANFLGPEDLLEGFEKPQRKRGTSLEVLRAKKHQFLVFLVKNFWFFTFWVPLKSTFFEGHKLVNFTLFCVFKSPKKTKIFVFYKNRKNRFLLKTGVLRVPMGLKIEKDFLRNLQKSWFLSILGPFWVFGNPKTQNAPIYIHYNKECN